MKCAVHLEEGIYSLLLKQLPDLFLCRVVLLQMLRPAQTASERERTLLDVVTSPRIRYIQWTVLSKAIFDLEFPAFDSHCIVMAWVAEPLLPATIEKSDRAAIHAFPVDVLRPMASHANVRANTHLLDEARPTDQILPPRRILQVQLLLAVDQAAKVWFLASRALEEADLGLCEGHQVVVVEVTWSGNPLVLVIAFFLANFHGLYLNIAPQDSQLFNLIVDLVDMLNIDRLLAAWAAHEGERDSQRAPLVFKKFKYAVGVEDVSTGELDTRLLLQLASVADCAKLVFCWQVDARWCLCNAFSLEARETLLLVLDSSTLVSAFLHFAAEWESTS